MQQQKTKLLNCLIREKQQGKSKRKQNKQNVFITLLYI